MISFFSFLVTQALRLVVWGLGWGIYVFAFRRRRVVLANLYTAFPRRSGRWRRNMALACCQRTVEMGLMALWTPFWGRETIRKRVHASPQLEKILQDIKESPKPRLFLVPHFSQIEMITLLPACTTIAREVGVIYRPFSHSWLEKWVRWTRERWGMRLLSRTNGIWAARDILKRTGCVALLFDQNAGDSGCLTTFFGKAASSTELPGLLASNSDAETYILYTEREKLGHSTIHCEPLSYDTKQPFSLTLQAQHWLENKLQNEPYCADWLWLHHRWKNQCDPTRIWRLSLKKNKLAETMAFYGWTELPKRTRIWIRLPNWLGDVIMALPLLKAIRQARPDAELVALSQAPVVPLLNRLGVVDATLPLPPKGRGYFWNFWRWRMRFPDVVLLWTHSFRSDLEAWLLGAPIRMGILRHTLRPLLTHVWKPSANLNEKSTHQVATGEQFLKAHGLDIPLNFSPFHWALSEQKWEGVSDTDECIGLICGTENCPQKRWPIRHWRALIEIIQQERPKAKILLLGTRRDTAITNEVARGYPSTVDLAGRTNLLSFADVLARCRIVIGNDTGGAHLANALGIPTAVIYGPTNAIRTGLIFKAPYAAIAANPREGLPAPIEIVNPKRVWETVRTWL